MTTPPAYDLQLGRNVAELDAALKGARHTSYWLDSPKRPASLAPLSKDVNAHLAIIGGGYCGLWTALLAKERNPGLDVVVLEAREVGWAASGRNGGFVEASLTHGPENGEKYFLRETECLASCGTAPCLQINEDHYENLDKAKVDALIAEKLK